MAKPHRPQPIHTVPFTVTMSGETYQCERTVRGEGKLTQTINVRGIGSETDSGAYGPGWSPWVSMEGIANLIAAQIIGKHLARLSSGPEPGRK
jgi:hypothetical protein